MLYGYARISNPKQSIDRQIRNLKEKYPNAVIVDEAFTGTTSARPKWQRLFAHVKEGDTIIVKRGDKVILVYPINDRIRRNPQLLDQPDSLFTWHNDSLMLVFNGISISDSTVTNIKRYDFQLFGKQRNSIFMPK